MTKHLAIIAGKGRMPLEVAHAAADDGYRLLVMPINGQADADFTGFETVPIRLGACYNQGLLRDRGIDQLVLAGKVGMHHYAIYGLTRMGSNCLVRCLPEVMIRFAAAQGLFCYKV